MIAISPSFSNEAQAIYAQRATNAALGFDHVRIVLVRPPSRYGQRHDDRLQSQLAAANDGAHRRRHGDERGRSTARWTTRTTARSSIRAISKFTSLSARPDGAAVHSRARHRVRRSGLGCDQARGDAEIGDGRGAGKRDVQRRRDGRQQCAGVERAGHLVELRSVGRDGRRKHRRAWRRQASAASATITASAPTKAGVISDNGGVVVTLPPASIALVSGGGQSGKAGSALSARPAVVRVLAADGIGVQRCDGQLRGAGGRARLARRAWRPTRPGWRRRH